MVNISSVIECIYDKIIYFTSICITLERNDVKISIGYAVLPRYIVCFWEVRAPQLQNWTLGLKIDVIGPNISITYYQPVDTKRIFVNELQAFSEYAFNAELVYSLPQANSGRFSLHLFSWTVATQHIYNGKNRYLV